MDWLDFVTNTDSLQVDYNGNVINPLNGRLQYSEAYYYNPYIEFVNAAGGKDIDYVINVREQTVIANGSTVINKGANSVVKGWSDNDSVINTNSASYAQIKTGDGNDTIENRAENVEINSGGKDVIYDFDSSTDVIKLSDTTAAVTDFTEKNNDIILTVGKGSITIKDAPRGTITVEQSGGTVTYKTLPTNVTYKATKSVVTLTKDFSGTLVAADLGLPVKEINGSAATGTADIRGMSTATKITASKGGSTLTGGAGNDTLVGGSGKDVFVVTGGSQLPTSEEEYWFMQSETK